MLLMHMSTLYFASCLRPPSYLTQLLLLRSIISVAVSSAILSAAEAPRDKLRSAASGASWFPSFTRLLIFGAVIGAAWYGWNTYGRKFFGVGGNSDPFGRGGGGLMWADSKRF